MGALPRHPQKKNRRRFHNAERKVAFTMWVLTFPAGWRAIRFYRNGGGRVDR